MDAILLRLLRNLHLFTVQIGIVRHFNWDLSSSYMDIFNFSHVYGHGFLYGLQLALLFSYPLCNATKVHQMHKFSW